MERFVGRYLATVARDPAAGMDDADAVVPQRQRWLRVVPAVLGDGDPRGARDVAADPSALTIGYAVAYTRRNGNTSFDSTRLRLVFRGGDYFIDGEG